MDAVTKQTVGGVPMAEYLADMIVQLDKAEIDKETAMLKLHTIKQLNNHHKNIIDAMRTEARIRELDKE